MRFVTGFNPQAFIFGNLIPYYDLEKMGMRWQSISEIRM